MKSHIERLRRGEPLSNSGSPKNLSDSWTVLAIVVTLIGILCTAVPLLTWFSLYDDEGYMLVSLAHYVNVGRLYTQTFSQYGPFYFYAQGIFFQLLHLPVTHDMGRLVTLIYWATSSLLAAIFVYRLSKSQFLACAAWICCMVAERVVVSEPGHPQQLILVLYLIAAYLSLPSPSGRSYLRLFLLGCVGAALAFTKLNVGVFYLAGLAQAVVCLLPSGRFRSIGLALTLSYAAGAPWMLMHANFSRGFLSYCLLATVGGIVVFVCAAQVRPSEPFTIRAAFYPGAGLIAGAALMVAATSLQGMSLGSLVWGVILNPLHQPNLFYVRLSVSGRNWVAAVILTAIVVGLKSWGQRLTGSPWIDLLKCAAGVVSILLLTLRSEIQWVLPLLPLALIPASRWRLDADAVFTRLFVTCMAVTQFLEPYPVGGSQVGIAAVPMLLWAFLCLTDGLVGLRQSSFKPSWHFRGDLRLDASIGSAIIVLFVGISVAHAIHLRPKSAWTALESRTWPAIHFPPPSGGLKGSEWLHLPPDLATQYRSIVRDIKTNCNILFTMPGMGSFNIWSGVPTPNGWNLTAWMKGISLDRQAEILGILRANPQSCAILNRSLVRFWDNDDGNEAALPLGRYVMTEMPKTAEFGDYEIRVNPERTEPWRQAP